MWYKVDILLPITQYTLLVNCMFTLRYASGKMSIMSISYFDNITIGSTSILTLCILIAFCTVYAYMQGCVCVCVCVCMLYVVIYACLCTVYECRLYLYSRPSSFKLSNYKLLSYFSLDIKIQPESEPGSSECWSDALTN